MSKNTLTLLDGTQITLYPLPRWDGYDEYIAIHRGKNVNYNNVEHFAELMDRQQEYQDALLEKAKEEQTEAKDILKENIRLLYDNAERILADSKMFLALLPDAGGLAYTGSGAFRYPCLGVMLQWWRTCPKAHYTEKEKEFWVNHMLGSPLSGMNSCTALTADGEQHPVKITPFIDLWRPFIEINRRYRGYSLTCEHYTLKEVVEKLKS